jgi:hypothetical protein
MFELLSFAFFSFIMGAALGYKVGDGTLHDLRNSYKDSKRAYDEAAKDYLRSKAAHVNLADHLMSAMIRGGFEFELVKRGDENFLITKNPNIGKELNTGEVDEQG